MSEPEATLPEYNSPPVSEVAISVEFLPLEKWRVPHTGAYWSSISDEYPQVESHLPLPSQIEKFGPEFWQGREMRLGIADADMVRSWLVTADGNRLIQIQRDRFIVNWRKVSTEDVYPRYVDEVRPRFAREWARFQQHLSKLKMDAPVVQQCEVTYVNDIPRGEGWESIADLPRLFSFWSNARSRGGFLPPLETLGFTGSFPMPDDRGRLHFSIQHVRRMPDDNELIQFRLTARGHPTSSADADVLEWVDLGRRWIVNGFTELTTDQAHAKWNRRR
jgi:uncharacterized protein (TIGR04255 family)